MAEFDGVIEADKLSSRFPFDDMFVYLLRCLNYRIFHASSNDTAKFGMQF